MRAAAGHPVRPGAGLTLLACAVALFACTAQEGERLGADPAAPHGSVGPTATDTTAPAGAEALAERYRRAGGDGHVYALQRESGPKGVPLLIVRTRNPDTDDEVFQELKESVVSFLADEEGLAPDRGYLMDVFGPDGSLLHRLDARP